MPNLQDLPVFADRWGYLYLEYGTLDQDAASVSFSNAQGSMRLPIDQCAMVLLGPGTSITHAATRTMAKNNCLLCCTGEGGIRWYSFGTGGTHSSHRLLFQARLYADESQRLEVARRMFSKRFAVPPDATLQQMRGMEGSRVRREYKELADTFGVEWKGRNYDQGNWDWADPVNRALSAANALLYGMCHAAILSAGYSAAIGFIHTGKMLSFVYDVADFYKTELTVPVAFEVVSEGVSDLERRVRKKCRTAFFHARLSQRILPDIAEVLNAPDDLEERSGELEGRAVSLADRTGGGDISG
ncbi:MAG: type I-E CRISPR-associated endonuclease Cas1 [Deltaproteobacteria bacterium]|nr:type I-E CRISPR-associated endonuclease Cas1 [Deltaproteobacteria bacterium]